MKNIRYYIYKSQLLAPVKYCINRVIKKEDATKMAIAVCGKANVNKSLVNEMIWALTKYHYRFDEYFMYDFHNISSKKRKSYITFYNVRYWTQKINQPENRLIFWDKEKTYEKFKKYYGRDLAFIPLKEDNFDVFYDFVSKHHKYIIKPASASCGEGIRIINQDDIDASIEEYFSQLKNEYGCDLVLEELIEQTNAIGKYHPTSVNTVRAFTIRMDDRVEVLPAVFRIGQNGSIIDNATAGGIMAAIDPETGILTRALDEYNHKFVVHPNTGVPIIGGQIPDWEDLKEMIKEMAYVVPTNRYTGWDIAHTPNGWVLVEANHLAEMIFQYTTKVGARERLIELFRELGVKPGL